MEATLTAAHGKGVPDESEDPAVEELEQTLNNVSPRVRQTDKQGPPVTDTAMVNLLANLNISREGAQTRPPSKRLRFGPLSRTRRTSKKLCGWIPWTR